METRDEPSLTSLFDLAKARREASSFDKIWRTVTQFYDSPTLEHTRIAAPEVLGYARQPAKGHRLGQRIDGKEKQNQVG